MCIVRLFAFIFRPIILINPQYRRRRRNRKRLFDALLAEFHTRFHSHAPEHLQDHCARRNTGWYIAQTSAISIALATILGIVIVRWWDKYDLYRDWYSFTPLVITPIVFCILWRVGARWNREFHDVIWKWIAWDTHTYQPPQGWRNNMQNLIDQGV
jgi:hypothetical protein